MLEGLTKKTYRCHLLNFGENKIAVHHGKFGHILNTLEQQWFFCILIGCIFYGIV